MDQGVLFSPNSIAITFARASWRAIITLASSSLVRVCDGSSSWCSAVRASSGCLMRPLKQVSSAVIGLFDHLTRCRIANARCRFACWFCTLMCAVAHCSHVAGAPMTGMASFSLTNAHWCHLQLCWRLLQAGQRSSAVQRRCGLWPVVCCQLQPLNSHSTWDSCITHSTGPIVHAVSNISSVAHTTGLWGVSMVAVIMCVLLLC